MHLINHYPACAPIVKRRLPDVDTVIGVFAAALLAFGLLVICNT
jgi:hypothetical protein